MLRAAINEGLLCRALGRQQKIANGGQNGDEQNADSGFALIEESLHKLEGAFEIAFGQGVAQFEDHTSARKWNKFANVLHDYLPILPKEDINFLQLVFDLTRVATGQQDEKFQRDIIEI